MMIFKVPPQFGQWSMSISKTRLSSLAQVMRRRVLRVSVLGSKVWACQALVIG
jgi:hypothetical protein